MDRVQQAEFTASADTETDMEDVPVLDDNTLRSFFNANHDDYMAYWDENLVLKIANFNLDACHMPIVEEVLKTGERARFEATQNDRVFDYRLYPAINALGECQGVAVYAHDISDRKSAEYEVQRLAYYDSLTGLPNRALLSDRLNQALTSARRHAHYGAVLFLDLDRFKNVNDSLGHNIGDELLKVVAERLERCRRDEDTIARMGGDEFVWVLPEIGTDAELSARAASRAAERLLSYFAENFQIGEHFLRITPSIGISLFNNQSIDVDDVLKQADGAMYRAKSIGLGQFQIFRPQMHDNAMERLRLEMKLHEAIEEGNLELHYQPQATVCSDELMGVETLLRWNDPDLGPISPGKFIPLAEETGLILQIGDWLIENVCQQIDTWNKSANGSPVPRVAINISPVQFRQPDFVHRIQSAFARWDIRIDQLELELTEGIVIEQIDQTVEKMKDLRALGVRFAIDDFGTGYSSLAYLKKLPLDILKIDQSFVNDIKEDAVSASIVSSIISMGQALGFELIAEGVEDADQLHFLRNRGCEIYQGYLYSRPVPKVDLEQLISRNAETALVTA